MQNVKSITQRPKAVLTDTRLVTVAEKRGRLSVETTRKNVPVMNSLDLILLKQDLVIAKLKGLRQAYIDLERDYRELDKLHLDIDERLHLLSSLTEEINKRFNND